MTKVDPAPIWDEAELWLIFMQLVPAGYGRNEKGCGGNYAFLEFR
jgi:hypothetical protein